MNDKKPKKPVSKTPNYGVDHTSPDSDADKTSPEKEKTKDQPKIEGDSDLSDLPISFE